MSYSIYLWQQPFLNPRVDSAWTHFPLNLIGLAVCALISYYCVELPAFAWRRKVEAKVSRTNRKPTIRVAAQAS
jgi:peptidoglycan/LPS O-acetylase OafA/YrhL